MQTINAEQTIIGTLLCFNDAIFEIGRELRPDHFEHPTHQQIYAQILKTIDANDTCTPVTLIHSMHRTQDDEFKAYVLKLFAEGRQVTSVGKLAEIIIAASTKRLIVAAAQMVLKEAEGKDNAALFSIMQQAIDGGLHNDCLRAVHDDAHVANAIAESLKKPRAIYKTGINVLDEKLKGGLHSGRVYCMAAPSGAGKTQLAVTISYALAEQNIPHLFVCAEMGEEEIHQRKIARQMGCSTDVFFDTDLQDDAFWHSFGAVASKQARACHYLSDPFITLERLKNATLSAIVRQRIKVLIIDYFQLIGGAKGEIMHDHYTQVAQWLAAIAKEKGITVFFTLQTNEEGKVLGGGAAKRSADVLLFGDRPNEDEDALFMYATKMRYGKVWKIGSRTNPALQINANGTHIEEI
jgi:replicative DNA helicase